MFMMRNTLQDLLLSLGHNKIIVSQLPEAARAWRGGAAPTCCRGALKAGSWVPRTAGPWWPACEPPTGLECSIMTACVNCRSRFAVDQRQRMSSRDARRPLLRETRDFLLTGLHAVFRTSRSALPV